MPHDSAAGSSSSIVGALWRSVRRRILAGLLLVLPVFITFLVVHWLYSTLRGYVIIPLGELVLWKVLRLQPDADLSFWFTHVGAPAIAILIALVILYILGFFARSRLKLVVDSLLLRMPVVSSVHNAVRQIFQTFDRQGKQQMSQRVVLVPFPHPGMKAPAFVTSSCRDAATQRTLLCVYVPTTPVPTSGYFLLFPEEDVTELNWTYEQALQAIISGGLTSPEVVSYYPASVDRSSSEG